MKLPVGVPQPPARVLGPQATILGVLLRPVVSVFRLQDAFVGQFCPQTAPKCPRTAPNGPKRGPRAPGWAPVGSGGCVLGRNPLGQRVGSLLLVFFAWVSPVNGVWCPLVQNGPKRPQQGPDGPGTCTTGGLVAVSWDGIHWGTVRAAFWSCFACFSPANGVRFGLKTAQKQSQIAPKWDLNGSENGRN